MSIVLLGDLSASVGDEVVEDVVWEKWKGKKND